MDENHDTKTEGRVGEIEKSVEKITRSAIDIGKLWAVHGLEIGRGALRASAETLRVTSDLLGQIAEKVGEPSEPEARNERDDKAA